MSFAGDRILIVEDDITIQSSLAYLLRWEGYEVAVANNGLEALEKIRAGLCPALILLDLMMPVMDGLEFIQAFRKDPLGASVPIVVLSGDGRVAERTASQNVAGHLLKPIRLEAVLEIVARQCHPSEKSRTKESHF